eukprot:6570432-Prymnesium_polylepis.1
MRSERYLRSLLLVVAGHALVMHGSAWVPSAAVIRRDRKAALWTAPCRMWAVHHVSREVSNSLLVILLVSRWWPFVLTCAQRSTDGRRKANERLSHSR